MSLGAHLEELRRKHKALSDQVEQAETHPGHDPLKVADLKKQKLRLKEEIERISAQV